MSVECGGSSERNDAIGLPDMTCDQLTTHINELRKASILVDKEAARCGLHKNIDAEVNDMLEAAKQREEETQIGETKRELDTLFSPKERMMFA